MPSSVTELSSNARPRTASNTFFAIQPDGHSAFVNPFPGTRRVTVEERPDSDIGIEVFAGTGAAVQTLDDEATGCCAYFWGLAGHPDVSSDSLLRWIVEQVHTGNSSALRQISGVYIVLIDDRRKGRIQMVSDVMGLRPWFVGHQFGRLVCGSDVWAIQEAGLNSGGVNYDAVASWLRYNYDCTGQSLFTDYPQMGFGAIGTWENNAYSETQYAQFTGGRNKPELPELLEHIHGGLSRSFDAVTRDLDHVQIALSGGFDSRYLAALASKRKHLKVESFSVRDREAEGLAATMAADGLGLSLEVLRTDGSLWNMFDEPYHFTAGGFPMTKQTSYFAASQRPGVPCLNGFIGDPMIRGTLDRAEKKLESETTEELPVVVQRINRLKHTHARFDLIDGDIVNHCDERTLEVWRRQMSRWTHTGHPFCATSFFVRQRSYIANNFLQHMDIAEAIVPFTGWEVLQYKFDNDASCYTWETYEALFKTYFPEIAHVPHNLKMGEKNDLDPTPSQCTKTWARAVLKGMSQTGSLPLINRRKALPRLVGALMGRRDVEVVALFLYRLFMLEQRLRRAGVAFDWDAI